MKCQSLFFGKNKKNTSKCCLSFISLFSPENRHFMQTVSSGDNLHEVSKPIFWKKIRKQKTMWVKISADKMSSAEIFTQYGKH